MKALKIVFLIGITVGAVVAATRAEAAAPPGSYQQSCRQINITGAKRPDALLTAECKNKNGQWRSASLYYKNCRGDIYNSAGTLGCGDDQIGNNDGLPPGAWRTACRDGYIIFREELPDDAEQAQTLRDGFGAGPGDAIIELRLTGGGEPRPRYWRVDTVPVA